MDMGVNRNGGDIKCTVDNKVGCFSAHSRKFKKFFLSPGDFTFVSISDNQSYFFKILCLGPVKTNGIYQFFNLGDTKAFEFIVIWGSLKKPI